MKCDHSEWSLAKPIIWHFQIVWWLLSTLENEIPSFAFFSVHVTIVNNKARIIN